MNDHLKKEQKEIDNYLITTCVALLAGSLILWSVSETPSWLSSIFSLIAVSSFILALGFSLWHKYRRAFRESLFKERREVVMKEAEGDIKVLLEMASEFGRLRARDYALSHISEAQKDDKDAFLEKMKKEIPDMPGRDRLASVFAENISNKIQTAHKESFHEKLKEKYAFPKYVFEYVAQKYRYHIFSIGLISLFVSLLLNLMS